jgi:hypothetical protein
LEVPKKCNGIKGKRDEYSSILFRAILWTMDQETSLELTNPTTAVVMKTIPMDNIETHEVP